MPRPIQPTTLILFLLGSFLGASVMATQPPSSQETNSSDLAREITEDEASVAFLDAVASGDIDEVASALTENPELARARNAAGVPAILVALYRDHREIADLIRAGRTALDIHEAAAVGDLEQLRRHLRTQEAALDQRSADGFTPLHLAAFFGRDRAVRLLLAAGCDVNAIADNPSRVRPIHSAAAGRRSSTVRIILAAGADPDAQQAGGFTALHSAAKHGDLPMVMALLANGANVLTASDDGRTAIDYAQETDAEAIAALLTEVPRQS